MSLPAASLYLLPLGWALLVWWLSTGVILYLDNLPRRTHRWSMLGATIVFAIALHRLHAASRDPSVAGAYIGFTCGLLAWGWHEMSFFTGFITGPLREPCPPGCTGWPRFRRAVQACLYHELASLASLAAILAVTRGGPNQVGTDAFLVLWIMRLSSKFNVFLGVRNLNAEFIPEHVAFIRSFLRRRPMNPLFPFSISLATIAAVLLVRHAFAPGLSAFAVTATSFVAGLLILGIVEHWFLVLPLPGAAALWNWCLRGTRRPAAWSARRPPAIPRLVPATLPMPNTHPIGGNP